MAWWVDMALEWKCGDCLDDLSLLLLGHGGIQRQSYESLGGASCDWAFHVSPECSSDWGVVEGLIVEDGIHTTLGQVGDEAIPLINVWQSQVEHVGSVLNSTWNMLQADAFLLGPWSELSQIPVPKPHSARLNKFKSLELSH